MVRKAAILFNNFQNYFLSGLDGHSFEVRKKMKYLCATFIFGQFILVFVLYGHSMMGGCIY